MRKLEKVWWFARMMCRTQCSQLWFVTGWKRTKGRWAKGKVTWDKAQRKSGASFQGSSPSRVTQDALRSFSNMLQQHMWNVIYQGSAVETQCPRFLSGAGHVGTLYQHIQISDSQKEMDVWQKAHCTNSLGTVSHSYQGTVGTLWKFKFPDTKGQPCQ